MAGIYGDVSLVYMREPSNYAADAVIGVTEDDTISHLYHKICFSLLFL